MSRPCPPPRRDPDVRRPSIVYGANILDPTTKQVRVDYVGKTVQKLAARERQHRGQDLTVEVREQPWSDLIIGNLFVIEQGMWTAKELGDREVYWIHRLRPRYNHDDNLDNPERITIPEARRQREERDRLAGRVSPTWDKPRAAAPVVVRSGPWWTPGRRRAAFWLGGWATASGLFAALIIHYLLLATVPALEWGVAGATLGAVAVWWGRLPRIRQRQVKRRVENAVTAAVIAAFVLAVGWLILTSHAAGAVAR